MLPLGREHLAHRLSKGLLQHHHRPGVCRSPCGEQSRGSTWVVGLEGRNHPHLPRGFFTQDGTRMQEGPLIFTKSPSWFKEEIFQQSHLQHPLVHPSVDDWTIKQPRHLHLRTFEFLYSDHLCGSNCLGSCHCFPFWIVVAFRNSLLKRWKNTRPYHFKGVLWLVYTAYWCSFKTTHHNICYSNAQHTEILNGTGTKGKTPLGILSTPCFSFQAFAPSSNQKTADDMPCSP